MQVLVHGHPLPAPDYPAIYDEATRKITATFNHYRNADDDPVLIDVACGHAKTNSQCPGTILAHADVQVVGVEAIINEDTGETVDHSIFDIGQKVRLKAKTRPANRSVNWSLLTNKHGWKIESTGGNTALLTVGDDPESVTIKACDQEMGHCCATADVWRRQCGCAGATCAIGSSEGNNSSVEYRLRLGNTANGQSAGFLRIHAERPDSTLATLAALEVVQHPSVDVVVSTPDLTYKRVFAAQGRVLATKNSDYKYEMLVLPGNGGTQIKTVVVENPEISPGVPDYNKLYITESKDGNPLAVYLFEWHDANPTGWTLQEGPTASSILRTTTNYEEVLGPTTRSERHIVHEGGINGPVVSDVKKTIETYPWGEEVTEEVVDPDGLRLTSTWSFYHNASTDGLNYGHVKAHTTAEGYWEYFDYRPIGDADETVKKVSPLEGNPFDEEAVDEANNLVTTTYTFLNVPVDQIIASRVEKTIVKAKNIVKENGYHVRWSQAVPTAQEGFYDEWNIACVAPDANVGRTAVTNFLDAVWDQPGDNLIDKTRFYEITAPAFAGKPRWNLAPSGMLTFYTYEMVGTDLADLKTYREYGTPDDTALPTKVINGEQTITVVNKQGTTMSTEVQRIEGSQKTSMSRIRVLEPLDGMFRPKDIEYAFGASLTVAYTTHQEYGCCGLAQSTDRAGQITYYYYDDLGRLDYTVAPTGVTTRYSYDAAGRQLGTSREVEIEEGVIEQTPIETIQYDAVGRLKSRMDTRGRYTFYTYQRFNVEDIGMVNETRVYPHSNASGSIQVTWSNAQGTIRSSTASTTEAWACPTPEQPDAGPTGTEALRELSREEMTLDWAGRATTTRRYFDLSWVGSGEPVRDVHYYESTSTYDALGQLSSQTDESGNITETEYEAGRPTEQRQGNQTGVEPVSTVSYVASDGTLRDYPTHVTRPKPTTSLSYTYADFEHKYAAETYSVWTKPATIAPWTEDVYNYQGQMIEHNVYPNGSMDPGAILARTRSIFDPTKGYLQAAQQWDMETGTGHLDTTYSYDGYGRQFKIKKPEGGFTKIGYDVYGRVERVVQAASGPDPDTEPAVFTNDLVVTEAVYQYGNDLVNKPHEYDRVVFVTTYERRHDADANYRGKLSADPSKARVTYKGIWYDPMGRVEYDVDYGTNGETPLAERPASRPDTGSTDTLVTRHVYEELGTVHKVHDNAGRITYTKQDLFGRVAKLVENYKNGIADGSDAPDEDRVTLYTYNSAGQVVTQTADLPGPNDQVTIYDYQGAISPVPSNTLLHTITYPPGSTPGSNVVLSYNGDGSVATRTDQRGVKLEFTYSDVGQRTREEVTSGWIAGAGNKKVVSTYTALGQPNTLTTYGGQDGNTVTSTIDYHDDYNGYGLVRTETQDPDGAGGVAGKTIAYGYDPTLGTRLTSLSYPGASRTITYAYSTHGVWSGQGTIGSAFNRISQIKAGTATLAEYSYVGLNRLIGRDDPANDFALRYGDVTGATYSGLDRLGRITRLEHVSYAGQSNFMASGATVMAGSQYRHDATGNRTIDKPHKAPEHARVYTYDDLNRLTDGQTGLLNAGASGLYGAPYGSPHTQDMQYDLLGNFDSLQTNQNVETREHNDANEITSRTASEVNPAAALYMMDGFASIDKTNVWDERAGSWAASGAAAATVEDSTEINRPWNASKAMMVARNLPNLNDIRTKVSVTFPDTVGVDIMYAGVVLNYTNDTHYWVYLIKCGRSWLTFRDRFYLYEVTPAGWQLRAASFEQEIVEPGETITLNVLQQGHYIGDCAVNMGAGYYSASVAPGAMGLIASVSGIAFDNLQVERIDWPSPATPTWQVYTGDLSIDTGTGRASLGGAGAPAMGLAVREGTWMGNFEADGLICSYVGGIAFHIRDKNNYYFVGPKGMLATLWKVVDGEPTELASGYVPGLQVTGAFHQWYIKVTGTDVEVWVKPQGLTWQHPIDSQGNGANQLTDIRGGLVGLAADGYGTGYATVCDYLRIGADDNDDYDLADTDEARITEDFNSASLTVSPSYDAAGNMTCDGIYNYTYDAWNRLVKVTRLGPTSDPQVVAEYGYDGLGRRTQKVVSSSGDRDRTEVFYYAGWQLLEIADGANQARQQFVWGSTYIDEPICMDVDTGNDGNCTDGTSRRFFYCQDANYNVVALRESTGGGNTIVERYEYDPYGAVRIYKGSPTAGAAELQQVTGRSLEWLDASLWENTILYCGYHFDNETDHYHVNQRMYMPQLARWPQRDSAGYVDGANLYQYVGGNPVTHTDPSGQSSEPDDWKKIGPNLFVAAKPLSDIKQLSRLVVSHDHSWQCVWPVHTPQPWISRPIYKHAFAACNDIYDISNLTANGGPRLGILFLAQNAGLERMRRYTGFATQLTRGPSLATHIRDQAQQGANPIAHMVIASHHHPKGAPFLHSGSYTNNQRDEFWISMLNAAAEVTESAPDFDKAMKRKGPPRCWFEVGADVRFLSCNSSSFAEAWSVKIGRSGHNPAYNARVAVTWGTLYYFDTDGKLGWFYDEYGKSQSGRVPYSEIYNIDEAWEKHMSP